MEWFWNGLLFEVLAGHTLDQIPLAIGIVLTSILRLVVVISYERNLLYLVIYIRNCWKLVF